jgi:hypothetical protein
MSKSPHSLKRRHTIQAAAALTVAASTPLVRAQAVQPVRIGYAMARTGP